MASMQVIAAVGDHQRYPFAVEAGKQESEQVTRGLIGPMSVLDDEDGRALVADPGQRAEYSGEQLAPFIAGIVGRRLGTEQPALGQQASDRWEVSLQFFDKLGTIVGQASERFGEGQIGQSDITEIDAMSDKSDQVPFGCLPNRLGQ